MSATIINWIAPIPPNYPISSLPPGFILFSNNFDDMYPQFSATWADNFLTINNTNVDIYTPAGYADPCTGAESGHCIDLNGTGGNDQGQLQSSYVFQPGAYVLSFNLNGSRRATVASATVSLGSYSHTFTLQPQDLTTGAVITLPVNLTTPSQLLFTGDPTTYDVGLFLDNVVVRTAGTPLVVSNSSTSCIASSKVYTTISSALAAAAPFSYIYVCPGTYAEQLTIQNPVNIIGVYTGGNGQLAGFNYPVLVSPAGGLKPNVLAGGKNIFPIAAGWQDGKPVAAQIAVVAASNTQISGIELNGSQNDPGSYSAHIGGIYFQNTSGEISGNVVLNQVLASAPTQETGFGILVESGLAPAAEGSLPGLSNINIEGNTVTNFQTVGIAALGFTTSANIAANTVSASTAPSAAATTNGIELVGTATNSAVLGNFVQNLASNSGYASVGVYLIAASGVSVDSNHITGVDAPIVTWTDPKTASPVNPAGSASQASITNNVLSGTAFSGASGIELCSNSNTVTSNTISAFANGGVHVSSACLSNTGTADATSGNSSYIAYNTITKTCAGIPVGGNSNTVSFNGVTGAKYAFWLGDSCGSPNAQTPTGNANLLNTLSGITPAAAPGVQFTPATRTKRHF